jgi:hypothetical protein
MPRSTMRVNTVTANRQHELSKRQANSDCTGVSENSAGAEKADAGYDRLDYTDRIRLYRQRAAPPLMPLACEFETRQACRP